MDVRLPTHYKESEMEVIQYEENGDGSVTLQVTMDTEESAKLIELGLLTALKNYIEDKEKEENA
tara:strand:+ start:28 stop:219 length:192 start_codon:yes stop_codon:yes gene_type:complete